MSEILRRNAPLNDNNAGLAGNSKKHLKNSPRKSRGETFSGRVVRISTRALFTPKNIQLQEDREKMVFGVDIRLTNPLSKLKPGMPADAEILIP